MPPCAQEQARLREKGIHRGIGIATFIKGTAPGPHGYYGTGGAPISSQDACVIKLEPNGGVICAVGVTDQGQGVDTVMGQIAAAALGVPIDSVRVLSGDTDATPFGGGTYASRATAIGGEAVYQAARDLRQEILELAGVLLQAEPDALDIVDGMIVDRSDGRKRLALAEIGRIGHYQVGELPNSVQPILSHTRRFRLVDDLYIFTNGIHGAHVEVDTDTGFIRLLEALGGGGLRPRHQPAAGRRAGARRLRAGHRRRAVRALPLRRGRPAAERLDGRLPDADGGRDARHRRRARADAVHRSRSSAPRASANPAPAPRPP